MRALRRLYAEYREAFSLFNADVRRYLLGSFLVGLGANVISLLFSLYLKRLSYTEAAIGTTLSIRAMGSALVALPASLVIARIDARKLLPASAVLAAAAYVSQSLSLSGAGISGSVLMAGALSTVYSIAGGPFLMRHSGEKERVHLFSLNGSLMFGTGVIGSLLAGAAKDLIFLASGDEVLAYRLAMLLGAAAVLAAALPFSRISPESREGPAPAPIGEAPSPEGGPAAPRKAEPGILLYLKVLSPGFLVGLGAGLTIPYLNLYFKNEFGLGDTLIGVAVAAGQVFTFLGITAGPAIARRLGKRRTIVLSQAVSVPFILVLAYLRFLPLALLAYLVRQALMNMSTPLQDAFALELVPQGRRHLMNALKMTTWTGSWMISARISGSIIYTRGFSPSFTLTALFYAASTLLFWFFFLRKAGPESGAGAQAAA